MVGSTQPSDAKTWHTFATPLDPKLKRFSIALRAAIPRTPAPLSIRLQRVLHYVEVGQPELSDSTTVYDYLSRTNYAVIDGERSLSEASDLVGDACGEPLYDSAALR